VVLAASLLTVAALGSVAGAADYVGSETCAECHDKVAADLKMTPHGKAGFAELAEHGCETCHGPASEHVNNPDDESARPSINRLSAGETSKMCTGCHAAGTQLFWQGSAHERRGLDCTSCHGIHEYGSTVAQLKKADLSENCFECHKNVRLDTRKTSHHPIREGRIGCSDCHNPHGTPTDSMLTAASVNDQCYECHAEKRGPFLWEHAPVRENCLVCHNPHGSNHLKLQKTSVPYICQQCHSNTRHPGTLYDATTLPGASRQSNRIFDRGCLNCHQTIHGTNHPSGPYLGR
jgi:DmsE family decaheme c-type cytochrome